MAKGLDIKDVNIYYGAFKAVEDVNLTINPRSVTAFIGPSGCGKSTVLRTLNRMHEVIPGGRVEGTISLDLSLIHIFLAPPSSTPTATCAWP